MEHVVVAKVSEIPIGERKIVLPFRGRAGIGVFNVNGSFFAIRNICPHKHGPLCTGRTQRSGCHRGSALRSECGYRCRRIGRGLTLSLAPVAPLNLPPENV